MLQKNVNTVMQYEIGWEIGYATTMVLKSTDTPPANVEAEVTLHLVTTRVNTWLLPAPSQLLHASPRHLYGSSFIPENEYFCVILRFLPSFIYIRMHMALDSSQLVAKSG